MGDQACIPPARFVPPLIAEPPKSYYKLTILQLWRRFMVQFIRAVLLIQLCWFCAVASAQPAAQVAATQPAPAPLPAPDQEIQAAFQVWTTPGPATRSNEDGLRAFARVVELKQRRAVSNDQWLKQ